jgi:hypothetical protein
MPMETKPITIREALEIYAGLQKLDGCKFENSGTTNYRIARNLRALQAVGEAVEAARKKILLDLAPGGTIADGTPDKVRYIEAWDATLRGPIGDDVKLFKLSFADLKVGENNINPTTLAALEPILVGQPELV